jgi:hypothetical protein
MLSKEQIDSFKTTGVLHLRNFFSPQEINGWKKETEDHFQNPDDWSIALRNTKTSEFDLTGSPSPASHPKMKEVYECLYQDVIWTGSNEVVVRAPKPGAAWEGPTAPHLDFPVYDRIRTLVNSVFYLSAVSTYGGPFIYWPGSHLAAWTYFKENPEDYMAQGKYSQDQVFRRLFTQMPTEPVSFTGEAGDLLLWHSLTMHSASLNLSDNPRLAVIGRWGNRLQTGEKRFDFAGDIWRL